MFTAVGHYPITKANFYLNDELVGISETSPFILSFVPSSVNSLSPDANKFKVVVYDSVYNKGELTIPIKIK